MYMNKQFSQRTNGKKYQIQNIMPAEFTRTVIIFHFDVEVDRN